MNLLKYFEWFENYREKLGTGFERLGKVKFFKKFAFGQPFDFFIKIVVFFMIIDYCLIGEKMNKFGFQDQAQEPFYWD